MNALGIMASMAQTPRISAEPKQHKPFIITYLTHFGGLNDIKINKA